MAVPAGVKHELTDRAGHRIHVGSRVRVAGIPEPVEVHAVDPRYGVLVILMPGRAGQQMGRMLRVGDVEAT